MSRVPVTQLTALAVAALLVGACGSDPDPQEEGCAGGVAVADEPETPTTPLELGQNTLRRALDDARSTSEVCIATAEMPGAAAALAAAGASVNARPESFTIVARGSASWVIGRDAVGALYGALELAERLRAGTAVLPVAEPVKGAPAVPFRAANHFLVLPEKGESEWWFYDPAFWREYLDMLVQARMNFLDLHGMENVDNTIFPNALLYFGRSSTFPELGVPAATREKNVAMLGSIVAMAKARGIRVGLMSYRADLTLDGTSPPQSVLDDAELRLYTREAVADLARRVPGLSRIGFRIGESAKKAAWYIDTYVAGVRNSGRDIGLYTRTWGTSKPEILSLASLVGGELLVEAKFNGEHLGPPYPVAGGLMAKYPNYSYEDYLAPPAPYSFVFQVRTGGTHRIFRHASFERTRRVAQTFTLSGAAGLSFEAPHAFLPQRDFYHAEEDVFSPWTFRRDEMQYLLYGRLSYDPTVPESVFRAAFAARVGTDALWAPLQAASDIVPWIQTAHTCGIDQRSFAPEMELGGDVAYWASAWNTKGQLCKEHGPMDLFAVAGPVDEASDLIAGRATTRVGPREVARLVLADAAAARAAASVALDPANPEARDVARECVAVADLGDYFGHKLRAATALAVFAGSGRSDYLAVAKAETRLADGAFRVLAAHTAYIAPFHENMRMRGLGVSPFHWSAEVPRLDEDPKSIDALVAKVPNAMPTFAGELPPAAEWLDAPRARGPGLLGLTVSPPEPRASEWTVKVDLASDPPPGTSVRVLWKSFSGAADWSGVDAQGSGRHFEAKVAGTGDGAMFAAEATAGGAGWRYPDVLIETPYVALPPR